MIRVTIPFTCILVLFFLTIFPYNAFAQQADKGLWTSVEVKKKLNKRLSVSFEEEYRELNQLGYTDQFKTSVGLSWKFKKYLKAEAGYTLTNKYDPTDLEQWKTKHRLTAALIYSFKVNRFDVSLQEKVQTNYRFGLLADEFKSNPAHYLRSKAKIAYNIKGYPINPYVFSEAFLSLNEPDGPSVPGSMQKFTALRLGSGVEYAFSKKLSASLGYLFETGNEWDAFTVNGNRAGRFEDFSSHVITLGLSITL